MKCPYQTKVIHQTEYIEGNYVKHCAQDITQFSDCLGSECPFYRTTENRVTGITREHCRRAESEGKAE